LEQLFLLADKAILRRILREVQTGNLTRERRLKTIARFINHSDVVGPVQVKRHHLG
jgi:hypothetical protein